MECLRDAPVVLTEGSQIERLRRDPTVQLDPHVLNAALLYGDRGPQCVARLYRQYLDIGRTHDLPMLLGTPTWRANPERLRLARLAERDVNGDAVRFVSGVRTTYGAYAGRVYIGGLLGCRGDAYRPAEALTADEARAFHSSQAQALCAAGADFLMAATLPAVSEALGIARALAACDCPYVLSFVVRRDGACLDGTPVAEAIRRIDADVSRPPTAYLVNCVHPSVFAAAFAAAQARDADVGQRLIGLQANTSALSPEELDNRRELDSESPAEFADAMVGLHGRLGIRVVGGCCGTDDRHIRCLAERLAQAR